ncbi:N-terminal domain of peptidoglycan hydrolase CwlO-containing protein [Pseudobutyrivibrio sp. YE44]|uniref:coiled-coil domain-containing protein n=1 Tax=Pseudobutyrivibrio sp. YE44 TaxID=1520802 RepID=UPI0008880BD4|nr:C40 family peptidase [Pseudobutyrivibrio sp. YE44]SDB51429.1 N-terminal domain of peptidoglycan hydrolase CwlO-containing protein [Pseudobutyrivibrio sp. YE44]
MKCNKFFKASLCIVVSVCLLASDSTTSKAVRSISEIEAEQDSLQEEIDTLDADLYNLVSQITEINTAISETEAEIADTEVALADATEARNQQYEAMKLRIKYMYEKEDESLFEMLVSSKSITQFLNKIEYASQVYDYDQQKLEQFIATQNEIEELSTALAEEKASLETSKTELKTQEAALETMVAEKRGEMDDLDAELKEAKEIAAREAALRAAREAAARAAAGGTSGEVRSTGGYNVNGDLNPGKTTGISGSSVVSYANQFVGNRYVWGGNSLTEGCDCSGFVQGVLANFGINYGSRMTSGSFRHVGNEVSYNYMQPGDIVCYPGHVAIYAGGGLIVEAQSTATGITNYRPVTCHSIITIRRVL